MPAAGSVDASYALVRLDRYPASLDACSKDTVYQGLGALEAAIGGAKSIPERE